MLDQFSLSNLTVVTPQIVRDESSLAITGKLIEGIGKLHKKNFSFNRHVFAFPALINVHDHLRGDYLPRVGPKEGNFYLNWSYWDNDLKSSIVYEERANITVEDCYYLGAYKNLFSGVVTVNDHFPHELNDPLIPKLPIRVIKEYNLAHECSSYDLKWGDGIEVEHDRAVQRNEPFITHLEEGFDEESQRGIEILEDLNCLDKYDVFIHCIGFSDEDIKKTKRAGATVVWCPASNMFMFNVTCKIKKILQAGINVSIGTDSTHTGSINILEEMRYARKLYRRMYGEDLAAKDIVYMVTVNAARAFRMEDRIGSLESGKLADVLVIKANVSDPYEALVNAGMDDIELLLMEGSPIYGSYAFEELFRLRDVDYNRILVNGREMLVKGDPEGLMKRIRDAVGFNKKLDFIPIDN